MIYKKSAKGKILLKLLVFFVLISNIFIAFQVVTAGVDINNEIETQAFDTPRAAFSRDDYEPILEEKKHSLGSVEVNNIDFNEKGSDFISDKEYLDLSDDIILKALNLSYQSTSFVETIRSARISNTNESIYDRNEITIKLNETVSVQYNKTKEDFESNLNLEGYLIYRSVLFDYNLLELYIRENGSSTTVKLEEGNYSTGKYDFIKFNYYNYFNKDFANFSLYFMWEFNITVSEWELFQYTYKELILGGNEETITPKFNYNLRVEAKKYNQTEFGFNPTDDPIFAKDFLVNLSINLPDKELLNEHEIKFNNDVISSSTIEDYIESDGTVNTDLLQSNRSRISINFTADFTVVFEEPVQNTWSIDRLVFSKNIRERIYFPTILQGPESIYLSNIKIFESTISIGQVIKNSTQFGRGFAYFDANVSLVDEDTQNSLVFTENATKKRGLALILPYLIKDEICPSIIRYNAPRTLNIIVLDNINMPLIDYKVDLLYYGQPYGTYISKERIQPVPTLYTDENGQLEIENVPNGNYTLKIYDVNDKVIFETSVSAYAEINYIITNIPHFPLWIMIFGGINSILFAAGIALYLANKKRR